MVVATSSPILKYHFKKINIYGVEPKRRKVEIAKKLSLVGANRTATTEAEWLSSNIKCLEISFNRQAKLLLRDKAFKWAY